jgi:WD40 repeat protein
MAWLLSVLFVLMGLAFQPLHAQDGVTLALDAEFDIGANTAYSCPYNAVLDAAADRVWVLMDNCFMRNFTLRAFNAADGSFANPEQDYADLLAPLEDQLVTTWVNPLALLPDGSFDLIYADSVNQSYDTLNLRFSPESGMVAVSDLPVLDLETLQSILPGYDYYPEATIYSRDHTLAAIYEEFALHVYDLQAETLRFTLETEAGSYGSFVYFSDDGTRLYVADLLYPDDVEDYRSTLSVYRLSDGELLETGIALPTFILWFSPDGRYAATTIDDSELGVIDLESGTLSNVLALSEPPRRVLACVNRAGDLSDVDFMTSGRLPLTDLVWLPDSSGFFTLNSSRGQGAGGGQRCDFEYSRLRRYRVSP